MSKLSKREEALGSGGARVASDVCLAGSVSKHHRAVAKGQTPRVIWLTGLSGAGKSTIANLLEVQLTAAGHHTFVLDGDDVRSRLNRDLGFSDEDRSENIRRVAEVASMMINAGLIVIVALISPFRVDRRLARRLFEPGEFIEVYLDVSFEVAMARDPKGLYAKARRGELKNFTGIDSLYEPPENPEVRIETAAVTPQQAVESIVEALRGVPGDLAG